MNSGTESFLDRIAPTFNGGYVQLVGIGPDKRNDIDSESFRPGDRKAQLSFIRRNSHRNVYWCVNELAEQKRKKATEDDIANILGVKVDLDPKNLDAEEHERARFQQTLDDFPLKPSLTIRSGRGLQAVWYLNAPLKASGYKDEVKVLNKRLVKYFGKGSDPIQNLDRILRVPGTEWYPTAKKKELGFTESRHVPDEFEWTGKTYTLEQLKQLDIVLPPLKDEDLRPEQDDVSPEDGYKLEYSPLSDKLRTEIESGDASKFDGDRSTWAFSLIKRMQSHRMTDEQIAAICLNPDYNISDHFRDQSDPLRQVARCLNKTRPDIIHLPTFQPVADAYFVEPSPQQFVVDPLIAAVKPAGLFGTGGEGKSLLAIRLGLCVASGRFFFGCPTTKGRVVILNAEEDDDDLHRRYWRIQENILNEMREHRATDEHEQQFISDLKENLYLVSVAGKDLRFIEPKGSSVEFSGNLDRLIDAMPDTVSLLIIDPMSRFMGYNENDNTACTMMINAVDFLKNSLGCAVLLIGHTSKQAEGKSSLATHDARGGSAITDGLRSVYRLKTVDAGMVGGVSGIDDRDVVDGNILQLRHTKSNTGARAKPIWLRRNGPDFEALDVHFISPEERNEKNFGLLYEWFADPDGNNSQPFSKNQITPRKGKHDPIWGGSLARDPARGLFKWAEGKGYMYRTGEHKNAPWVVMWAEGDAL